MFTLNKTGIVMASLKEAFWAKVRQLHRAESTGKAYWQWIREYCDFHVGADGKPVSPRTLDKSHVQSWLTHLANHKRVSESAHEQAFYAILFLYNKVYETPMEGVRSERPKPKVNIPVVMTYDEVSAVIQRMQGPYKLLAQIMYGCGLRRSEAVSLRLKDVDLGNGMFSIWHSKHKHSRTVPIPTSIYDALRKQINESISWQRHDQDNCYGGVMIPRGAAEHRKPSFDVRWYWLFNSGNLSRDSITNRLARFHLDAGYASRLVSQAAKDAGIMKRVGAHTLRHSYGTHLLMSGVNIREIQRLFGHASVETTQRYTHVSLFADQTTPSPLDRLASLTAA